MKFPKLKKKINAFLVGEEGKISKSNVIKGGILLGSIVLTIGTVAAGHSSYDYHTNNSLSDTTHQNSVAHHDDHVSHGDCCGSQVGTHW